MKVVLRVNKGGKDRKEVKEHLLRAHHSSKRFKIKGKEAIIQPSPDIMKSLVLGTPRNSNKDSRGMIVRDTLTQGIHNNLNLCFLHLSPTPTTLIPLNHPPCPFNLNLSTLPTCILP